MAVLEIHAEAILQRTADNFGIALELAHGSDA
jgi:hypothetical protein